MIYIKEEENRKIIEIRPLQEAVNEKLGSYRKNLHKDLQEVLNEYKDLSVHDATQKFILKFNEDLNNYMGSICNISVKWHKNEENVITKAIVTPHPQGVPVAYGKWFSTWKKTYNVKSID